MGRLAPIDQSSVSASQPFFSTAGEKHFGFVSSLHEIEHTPQRHLCM
jgi:hypothetical protein